MWRKSNYNLPWYSNLANSFQPREIFWKSKTDWCMGTAQRKSSQSPKSINAWAHLYVYTSAITLNLKPDIESLQVTLFQSCSSTFKSSYDLGLRLHPPQIALIKPGILKPFADFTFFYILSRDFYLSPHFVWHWSLNCAGMKPFHVFSICLQLCYKISGERTSQVCLTNTVP